MNGSERPADVPGSEERIAAWAAMHANYARRLPSQLDGLETALSDAREDPAARAVAYGIAHRLHGTAGSYGHAELGRTLAKIEALLAPPDDDVLATGAPPWDQLLAMLAAARGQVVGGGDPDHTPEPGLADPATGWSRLVLVVDDDADFLDLVERCARDMSTAILRAGTAAEALEIAQSRPLAGVMLDVHLGPGASFELAHEIRRTRHNATVPIAFASIDQQLETRLLAFEAGGSKFLEKPVTRDGVVAVLQHLRTVGARDAGRILVVEDDLALAERYQAILEESGYLVEAIGSAEQLMDRLDALRPDVLLLDVNLPGISGLDACRALRTSVHWELLPILMVTGRTDDRTRLDAYRAGASDVVAKPIVVEELLARVGVQLDRVRAVRERAEKDALSGLLLRRAFLEALARSASHGGRQGMPLSVVLIDLDHFKLINDTHGHFAGDQVISRFGEMVTRRFRAEDLRGRWGGEEFILAFPGQNADFAVAAARRLLEDFGRLGLESDDGSPFQATFSAGVASYPADGPDISQWIRVADERLYQAKQGGRNRVHGPSPAVLDGLSAPTEVVTP